MDEQKETARQDAQASPEIPPPAPPPIDPPQPPPHPSPEKDEGPKKMSTSDKMMVWATCVIAAGTLVSAAAICLQWREMVNGGADTTAIKNAAQKQADAAQKFSDTAILINGNANSAVGKLDAQATNAANSIKTTQQAIRLEQRAWVVVNRMEGIPELGKPWEVRVVFTNNGRTPAKHTRISCNVEPEPPGTRFHLNEVPPVSRTLIVPNQEAYCILTPATNPKLVTQQVLDIVEGRKLIFVIFGSVGYDDIFHIAHWYTFCRVLQPEHMNFESCETGGDDTGDGNPPQRNRQNPNETTPTFTFSPPN